ncbi:Tetratricopeptide repeat (TPR)-like superfamily protein [Striga hermonthica]|uniref:Tetratricopeptide repeat (TPR)-like superfamily protein n=1 Tax=Striga hermonthica TaxID=68872 RepID=A0A9N7R5U4_STRHE|nr:Tetratricopeptide repeat (TPR)-like superfamily protein [Striga hermonthica]
MNRPTLERVTFHRCLLWKDSRDSLCWPDLPAGVQKTASQNERGPVGGKAGLAEVRIEDFLVLIHAQLIKLGLTSNVFLGNRCIDVCVKSGAVNDALKIFNDIPSKNIFSWNLYLKIFVKYFDLETAHRVFDEMPQRDTVSFNTIISAYVACGFLDTAWGVFLEMREFSVEPSEFTFSVVLCCVKCGNHAKEMHGYIVRHFGYFSNLVVGNSLIDVYGKLGLVDYALAVFLSMEKVDVVSWNSMICGCCKSGHEQLALQKFWLMINSGYQVDEFTVSTVLTACSNLRNLGKGEQVLCYCVKRGFLSNSIVSSAVIDLFSNCKRVESAACLFKESCVLDSAICNSMVACFESHGLVEHAMHLFIDTFKENIRPTEFTFSCVLHSASFFVPVEQGSQIHSLVVKTGFQSDSIVASSLVIMYGKYGSIDSALKVFENMVFRDLIAWNTIILVLAHNGKPFEAICYFQKLLQSGLRPDQKTFYGVLLSCNYGGFLEEGMKIFSSMGMRHGVEPEDEHYAPIVEILIRAGQISEAVDLLQLHKCETHAFVWEYLLRVCEDLKMIEKAAKRLMELDPLSPFPFLILAKAYEKSGKWESLVRVKREMKRMMSEEVVDCSWISIKDRVISFDANDMIHSGGKDVYSVLLLLMQEIWDENDTSFE